MKRIPAKLRRGFLPSHKRRDKVGATGWVGVSYF